MILCYLEGLTHELAAERLGRPVGTVRSRLATARDRLRARLTRRGLAPAVIPALISADGVAIVVPAALEEATVHASAKVALGKQALAGAVSAEALALMENTLKNMMISRLVLRCASVLAAGFVTFGAGAMALSSLGGENITRAGRAVGRDRRANKIPRGSGPGGKRPPCPGIPRRGRRTAGRCPRSGQDSGADRGPGRDGR